MESNVWGPTPYKSLGGAYYFVAFIDSYSRKILLFLMAHKSQVFNMFKAWKVQGERLTGRKVKTLRSDNGGEHTSHEFQSFEMKEGIRGQFTTPHIPQENGVAERANGTLLDMCRSIKLEAGLSRPHWSPRSGCQNPRKRPRSRGTQSLPA